MSEDLNSPGHEKLNWIHTHTRVFNIIHVTLTWKLRCDKNRINGTNHLTIQLNAPSQQTTSHQRRRDFFTSRKHRPDSSPQLTATQTRAASASSFCVSGNSRVYVMALNSLAQADTLQMHPIHQKVKKKKALKLHILRRMEAKVAHFYHLAQHRTCYHIHW